MAWTSTAAWVARSTFKPHIHKTPCRICDAAIAAEFPTRGSAPASNIAVSSGMSSSSSANNSNAAGAETHGKSLRDIARNTTPGDGYSDWRPVSSPNLTTTEKLMRPSTVQEWRRTGIEEWERLFRHGHDPRGDVLRQYLKGGGTTEAPESLLAPCAEYLLSLVGRSSKCQPQQQMSQECFSPGRQAAGESDPLLFIAPLVRLEKKVSPSPTPEKVGEEDVFIERVKRAFPGNKEEVERQMRFRRALLDFNSLTSIPFFLSFGTAIAAHREGYFIPHDDDIDIGVFYEDVPVYGATSAPSGNHTSVAASAAAAENGVLKLLRELTEKGIFIPFDICGEVDMGLEIRLLHVPTGVKLDVNLYYPPLKGDDDALVTKYGSFVWSATYYEKAAERKYGRYRYRHTPFKDALEPTLFCSASSSSVSGRGKVLKVPPESYLAEYYGADWRVPKKYSYAEGLATEYKSMIEE